MKPDQTGSEQSVARAVALMRLVAAHGRAGARLLDLASESGIARPTVYRILQRLCEERLVTQRSHNKRYLMGSLAFELGLAAHTPLQRLEHMQPHLQALAETTGDTAFLTMRTGDEVVCLYIAEGSFPIRARSFELGCRRPLGLGTGSPGLAFLAALPDEDARAVITRNMENRHRVARVEEGLLSRLEQVRKEGAISRETVTAGIKGIAVVVPTTVGVPYLAVSLGAISSRLPDQRIKGLWKKLNTTALRLAALVDEGA